MSGTEPRLLLIFRGSPDTTRLDHLRQALGLRPHGRLTDLEDAHFGSADLAGAPAQMNLWRDDGDHWSISIDADPSAPLADDDIARWQSAAEAAAADAGMALLERRSFPGRAAETAPLRPVGLYREMYNGSHPELPSLFESYTSRVIEDRDRILEYLRTAPAVFDVLDVLVDVVNGTDRIMSASSLRSDGVWIWRVDSIHYLSHYELDIPDSFLRHVRARDYRPPADVDYDEFEAQILKYF
ncbi:hypothetical protein BJY24_001722 [Nocardia transvalensis]|uniref:Uncharacterized protein n=1 Tax=Nocardia transvalensis TaxID=37333 RepID=A0A7W9UHM0_9NOCA|nr:hypothetical protein [Nocardia transvalensis]MBB5912855.1 hypothetical protein [Nocardia transvalensis]